MWSRRSILLGAAGAGFARATPVWPQEALSNDELFFNEGRYLPTYLDLKARSEAGEEAARQMLSQFAAFLGDEETAVGLYERPPRSSVVPPDLEGAVARDALEAITEAARDSRIVILNEAHDVSGHRAFAARVMRALRPLGYDWFAAETFTQPQPVPLVRIGAYTKGAPFLSRYGYYTDDPVFAEMVREAARLGYRFSDYEQRFDQRAPEGADSAAQIAAREEAQADNLIANILSTHPEARVFVYVGYSHAMEVEGRGGLWFAARLKAKTGIDPLTIEQSMNWPALAPQNDAPHVAAVLARFSPEAPIVASKDGESIATPNYAGKMDLSVFHPRLAPVAGRPGWLAADPERRRVTIKVPPLDELVLIQALSMAETTAGPPSDHYLLAPGASEATFFLHPGRYFFRQETAAGIQPAFGALKVD
ncbi:hypothetical protein NI456_15155 [Brevundimonas diminuta]|uniref:hypothetical protein n=1 Tax=Brevundimonas diminuta TaxID=293 RepID=UPI00209750DB|nr:hypothetical protein [Brevundimonas diminuta]MCO8020202.1 hypothetical protein [Brevundimonas diminuta]MCO8023180.1 hypothetical protein [Brevundimonas diminuta]